MSARIERTERAAVPFLARVSTLLRERHAMTSWNKAADTVATAPIIAARIVSERPMQILVISVESGRGRCDEPPARGVSFAGLLPLLNRRLCRLQAARLY